MQERVYFGGQQSASTNGRNCAHRASARKPSRCHLGWRWPARPATGCAGGSGSRARGWRRHDRHSGRWFSHRHRQDCGADQSPASLPQACGAVTPLMLPKRGCGPKSDASFGCVEAGRMMAALVGIGPTRFQTSDMKAAALISCSSLNRPLTLDVNQCRRIEIYAPVFLNERGIQ